MIPEALPDGPADKGVSAAVGPDAMPPHRRLDATANGTVTVTETVIETVTETGSATASDARRPSSAGHQLV